MNLEDEFSLIEVKIDVTWLFYSFRWIACRAFLQLLLLLLLLLSLLFGAPIDIIRRNLKPSSGALFSCLSPPKDPSLWFLRKTSTASSWLSRFKATMTTMMTMATMTRNQERAHTWPDGKPRSLTSYFDHHWWKDNWCDLDNDHSGDPAFDGSLLPKPRRIALLILFAFEVVFMRQKTYQQ